MKYFFGYSTTKGKKAYLCGMMYCFNPDSDMALADGRPYYRPPAEIGRMENDLCLLPLWYAVSGSVVKVPEVRQAEGWLESAAYVPSSVSVADAWQPMPVCPWGWNPALVYRLRKAGMPDSCFPSENQLVRIRELSSRRLCVGLQQLLRPLEGTGGEAFACAGMEEVKRRVARCGDSLLKAPWSGSGRGLVRVSSATWTASVEGWAARILRTQGVLMVEPIYNKVRDFAMEFQVGADGQVVFSGYSWFETDAHGNYKLNFLLADADIEARLAMLVPVALLRRVQRTLSAALQQLIGTDYTGYLGVDMMICRAADGSHWLHPCVEVNLRMNMGVVSRVVYDRFVSPGCKGRFVIEHYGKEGEAWQSHREMERKWPVELRDGRLAGGYLSLIPVEETTRYQAFVMIDY